MTSFARTTSFAERPEYSRLGYFVHSLSKKVTTCIDLTVFLKKTLPVLYSFLFYINKLGKFVYNELKSFKSLFFEEWMMESG